MTVKYDERFYATRNSKTLYAARTILRMIFQNRDINSVIDFGCGVGTWLKTAEEYGAEYTVGVEGEWVDKSLFVANGELRVKDFEKKLAIEEKFDLAISLEVAEHISLESSKRFVDDICASSDLVLFSAAVVGQGGRGHVNEQNQSFWVGLFEANGYKCMDVIRPAIWNEDEIEVWYKQNTFVFSKNTIKFDMADRSVFPADIIHPDLFKIYRDQGIYQSIQTMMKLPSKILKKLV